MNAKHKAQTIAAMLTAAHGSLAQMLTILDETCERANKASLKDDRDATSVANECTGAALHAQHITAKVQELLTGLVALNSLPVSK